MKKRLPIFIFYAALSIWLVAYTHKRFNGYDLSIIWQAGGAILNHQSPYLFGHQNPFKYSPSFAMCLALFQWLPYVWLPAIVCVLNIAMLLRLTFLTLRLFEVEIGFGSRLQKNLMIYLPWFLVFQGIGAQFEGGQTTILLLYFGMEGQEQHHRGKNWGMALASLVGLIKPQFLVLPFLLAVLDFRKRAQAYMIAGACLGFALLFPFFLGVTQGVNLYQDWFKILSLSTPEVLTNRVGNGNLGLYSFFYHLWSWPILLINILVLGVVLICAFLIYRTRSRVLAVGSAYWIAYLFSPISFAYSQILMMIPGTLAVGCVLDFKNKKFSFTRLAVLILFLIACWILQYDTVGKVAYQQIVFYRLNAWFSLGLLWALVPRHCEQKQSHLAAKELGSF